MAGFARGYMASGIGRTQADRLQVKNAAFCLSLPERVEAR